jgi:hypothetical protein
VSHVVWGIFERALKQCITGVEGRGVGVALYRAIDTVHGGADLTVYCILSRLESFEFGRKCCPGGLCVRVGGGSGGAGRCLLAVVELLVVGCGGRWWVFLVAKSFSGVVLVKSCRSFAEVVEPSAGGGFGACRCQCISPLVWGLFFAPVLLVGSVTVPLCCRSVYWS